MASDRLRQQLRAVDLMYWGADRWEPADDHGFYQKAFCEERQNP